MLWVVVLLPLYCALDAAQLIRVLPSVICVLKYHAEKYKQVKEAVLKTSEQKTGSGTFDTAILKSLSPIFHQSFEMWRNTTCN